MSDLGGGTSRNPNSPRPLSTCALTPSSLKPAGAPVISTAMSAPLEVGERERQRNEESVVPLVDVPVMLARDFHRDSERQGIPAPHDASRHHFGGDGRTTRRRSVQAYLRLNRHPRQDRQERRESRSGLPPNLPEPQGCHASDHFPFSWFSIRTRSSETDGGPQRTRRTSPSESVTTAAGSPSMRKASSAP